MKNQTLIIESNFHDAGTKKIRIPANISLDGYLNDLSYLESQQNDASARRRLKGIEKAFCSSPGCGCSINEVSK